MGEAQEREEMNVMDQVTTGIVMGSPITVRALFISKFRALD